jgi:tetratricopeptide (TPR) repeat protein
VINKSAILIILALAFTIQAGAQFKLYERGHDSYSAGKYSDAIRLFSDYLTKATRDKAIDVDVFYLRALSYFKTQQFSEAIPDFEESVLRGHTNKGNIYWFMAKCYENLKQYDEALNSYNNALRELNENKEASAKLYNERGNLHKVMGNTSLAAADHSEVTALQTKPKSGDDGGKKLSAEPPREDTKVDQKSLAGKTTTQKQPNKKTTGNTTTRNDDTEASTPSSDKSVVPESATPVIVRHEPSTPVPVNTLADVYKNEKRYALVIGNGTYGKEIGTLRNPINDATDMAKELREAHFDVQLLTDATYGQIRAALMKFKEKLDAGDKENTVGLFYFAGHGLQFDEENYLVPVDASVHYEDDIPRYCFPIQRMVLGNMERSNTRMNIVILDACRNNPFPSLSRSTGRSGLGEMKRGRGSFIAYATAPGSVASDGHGRNGLYTQELLKALQKNGLTIEQVFKEVRANVLRLSGNKQNTWESSNIIGEFHFKY